MKQLDTEVVSVISRKEYGHLPDNRLMREFMRRHYPKAEFTVLTGVPEQEVVMHLEEQEKHMLHEKHMLVVLGAYRRGFISRWMRQSMADVLMEELNACLFIAHNR